MESRLLSVIVDSKHSLDVVAQCQSVMVDLQGLVKWLCWFEIWSALSKKSSHFRSDTSECSQFSLLLVYNLSTKYKYMEYMYDFFKYWFPWCSYPQAIDAFPV